MPDQNDSLPIRSEADGLDQRVHTKIVDFTAPAGANNQAQVSEKLVHVRDHGQDPADAKKQLRLSELGYANADGAYDGTNNTNPSNTGLVGMSRNASPADTQQTLRLTAKANGDGSVRSLDIALHDEAGEPYTEENPLAVKISDGERDEVNDYNTDDAVAAAGTSTHDYEVTAAKEFKLTQVTASGSGKMKIEIQIEDGVASDSFDTAFVKFSSVANPNIDHMLQEPITVAAGVRVRVIRTNRDLSAMDLYSTISGHEIDA